jgi:hypothetical protein
LRSNTKGYGGNTHYTDSQNNDTTASSGRELYHLQFLLQAASPEAFGYTCIPYHCVIKREMTLPLVWILDCFVMLNTKGTPVASVDSDIFWEGIPRTERIGDAPAVVIIMVKVKVKLFLCFN